MSNLVFDNLPKRQTSEETKQGLEPVEAIPYFVKRQAKLVRKAEIDRTTEVCVSKLVISPWTGPTAAYELENFNSHLAQFPFAKGYATKLGAIPAIVRFKGHQDLSIRSAAKETLARLGYVDVLPHKGIRILCIDGGGMKGVIALEILRQLERETGRLIHELFDFMVGVSTGSIITALLGVKKLTVTEVKEIYNDLGAEVFKQSLYDGVKGMVTSHAYYDTEKYENIVKVSVDDVKKDPNKDQSLGIHWRTKDACHLENRRSKAGHHRISCQWQ